MPGARHLVLLFGGARPNFVKLAPLARALDREPDGAALAAAKSATPLAHLSRPASRPDVGIALWDGRAGERAGAAVLRMLETSVPPPLGRAPIASRQ